MADRGAITPKILLDHLRAMEQRITSTLGKRIDGVEEHLGGVEQRLTTRMDSLERGLGEVKEDVRHLHDALQRVYEKRVQMVERLDRIEEQELPAIKRAIGLA